MKQSDTYSYMKEIDNINNISLYENPYNVGFGFLIRNDSELINMNNDLSNGKTYNSYVELQNDFSNKLVGEDLYELIEFEIPILFLFTQTPYDIRKKESLDREEFRRLQRENKKTVILSAIKNCFMKKNREAEKDNYINQFIRFSLRCQYI